MRIPLDHHGRVVGEPDGAVFRHRLVEAALTIGEHRVVPLAISRRARLGQLVLRADRLHRVMPAKLPAQVFAGDELAETGMKGRDVIVLEVDLDEGLPVVVAFVQMDAVESVAREVEISQGAERGKVGGDVAAGGSRSCGGGCLSWRLDRCSCRGQRRRVVARRCFEQHAVPALQRIAGQRAARVVGEVRRADEFAAEVVGPAVQRADDVASGVAAAAQHDGLAVPADVGQQPHAAVRSQQRAALALLRQGVEVARRRHGQFMADVARRGCEQGAHFALVHIGVEIARNGELGATRGQGGRGDAQVGHGAGFLQ